MEPPAKRQKGNKYLVDDTNEDDDELTLAPEELNQKRDPSFQLEQGRALAANKLKFRLEEVIAKYSRDFTGIGDEIDLVTGEVVVDNGHVRSMRSEKDTGDGADDVDEDSDEEEERILRGIKSADRAPGLQSANAMAIPQDPWQVEGPNWSAGPVMGAPSRLTSLFPNNPSFMTPSGSFSSLHFGNPMRMSADPVWQAPELPESAFANRFGANGQHLGFGMNSTTRAVVKKCFPPPVNPESDEEDALLGVSGNVLKKKPEKESPLIKQKFPAIDSSPNEDHVHKEVVSDLIENLLSTPPSIQRAKITRSLGRPSKLKEIQAADSDSEQKEESRIRQVKGAQRDEANAGVNGKASHVNQAKDSWDEDDLKDFLDITGKNVKPAGQILFVDIRTTKRQSSELSAVDGHKNETPRVIENTSAQSPARDGESMAMDAATEHSVTAERKVERLTASSKKRQPQERLVRNVVDPSFAFSDGESMPPMRRGRGRPRSKPAKASTADTPKQGPSVNTIREVPPSEAKDSYIDDRAPSKKAKQINMDAASSQVPQEVAEPQAVKAAFEPNAIDPSFAFSDDEVLLPRRPKRAARKSDPAVTAEGLSEEHSSTIPGPKPGAPVSVSKKASQFETAASSAGDAKEDKNASQKASQDMDGVPLQHPHRRQKEQEPVAGAQPMSASLPSVEQEEHVQATAAAKSSLVAAAVAPSPSLNVQSIDAAAMEENPGLQSEQPKPTTEDGKRRISRSSSASNSRHRRLSKRRHSSRELGEPSPPDAPAPTGSPEQQPSPSSATAVAPPPPTTPRRGKPQKPLPKTPAATSSALELISLLSDDDDDEDEISFDLADFTPSGHHRILAHHPGSVAPSSSSIFPRLLGSANARTAKSNTSTKEKNKKRASLFGPYASHHATPRTPGSATTTKSTSKKKRSSLARSIARARPRRHSHSEGGMAAVPASPAGSVVQTPGGTKRRCGVDGFRCDRDFCFVCL